MKVLDLRDVCALLHISEQTGRNKIGKENAMPPSFIPHGSRRRLFLESEVQKWLSEQAGVEMDAAQPAHPKAGRGRPRKVVNGRTGGG